ncbi:unnamed protein product [Dicrocoelium dendriticum]|nr:unnamed protein product [Dicrocoelium dendriticum]
MTADLQNGQPRFVPPPPIAVSHELPSSIRISIPKIGTLIPNRIFVGGISSNTTEEELKSFFSTFGTIKDVKVICDKSGLAKGSYGFVTFENQETAEAIIKNEAEPLIFKDRKLNIGYAVRKQHIFPKQEIAGSVLLARSACHFTNGLTLFQLCSHDHPILTMNQASTSWTCPHCCAATEARGTMELQTPITNFAPHCDSSFYALRDTAEVQAPTANIAFQPQASTSTDDCTVQDVRHILLGYPAECHGETAGAASHSVTHRVYSGVSPYNGQRNPLNMKSPDGSLTEGSRQQTAFHFAWKNNASETFNTFDSFASSARDMDRDQLKVNNAAFSGQNWHLTEEVHGRDEPLQSMPMRLDLLNMLMTPPQQKTSLRNEGVRTSISHDFTFESPSTLTPNSPKSSNEPYAKFDHLQPPEQEFYHLARNAEPILSKTNSCGVNTSQSLVTNNGTFACGDITKHRSN